MQYGSRGELRSRCGKRRKDDVIRPVSGTPHTLARPIPALFLLPASLPRPKRASPPQAAVMASALYVCFSHPRRLPLFHPVTHHLSSTQTPDTDSTLPLLHTGLSFPFDALPRTFFSYSAFIAHKQDRHTYSSKTPKASIGIASFYSPIYFSAAYTLHHLPNLSQPSP